MRFKPGIVYVIGIDDERFKHIYKIGLTSEGGTETRRSDLQTGCPWLLYIAAEYWCIDAPDLEYHLHQRFAPYRIQGEWFNLSRVSGNGRDTLLLIKRAIWAYLDGVPERGAVSQ